MRSKSLNKCFVYKFQLKTKISQIYFEIFIGLSDKIVIFWVHVKKFGFLKTFSFIYRWLIHGGLDFEVEFFILISIVLSQSTQNISI